MPVDSLYRRLLSQGYDDLPPILQAFHDQPNNALGTMDVTWATGWFRHLAAQMLRVPGLGLGQTCRLTVRATQSEETWDRQIGQTHMFTRQWLEGTFLIEQAGPFRFRFQVDANGIGMTFRQVGCRLGPLPLPAFCSPTVAAEVRAGEGSWHVRVEIGTRLLGWICRYEGSMRPECK